MGRRKTENKVDFKADYILKLEKREEEKAKKEAGQGENIPDNLITWVFSLFSFTNPYIYLLFLLYVGSLTLSYCAQPPECGFDALCASSITNSIVIVFFSTL